jgi:hypothetical protein
MELLMRHCDEDRKSASALVANTIHKSTWPGQPATGFKPTTIADWRDKAKNDARNPSTETYQTTVDSYRLSGDVSSEKIRRDLLKRLGAIIRAIAIQKN